MTNDTRIALEKIKPLAYELNIDVRADDNFLYCNGQAIGIAYNSTYATIVEFIAYAMNDICCKEYRFNMPQELEKAIKRYWFSKEQMKKIRRNMDENEPGV